MPRPNYPGWLTKAATVTICGLAVAHVTSILVAAEGPTDAFLIGLLAASVLPYLLCLVPLKWAQYVGASLVGVIAVGLFDAFMYWSVFIEPRGSTAALGLLFAPIWKLLVVLPLGTLIGFAIDAAAARRFT